jgi:hypothetical protein
MKPNERLTLSMPMRAPGSGLQQFNIRGRVGRQVVELCTYWHPAGIWGLLYWYAHQPLYGPLVQGVVAERLHARQKRSTMRGRSSRRIRGIGGTDYGNDARRRPRRRVGVGTNVNWRCVAGGSRGAFLFRSTGTST